MNSDELYEKELEKYSIFATLLCSMLETIKIIRRSQIAKESEYNTLTSNLSRKEKRDTKDVNKNALKELEKEKKVVLKDNKKLMSILFGCKEIMDDSDKELIEMLNNVTINLNSDSYDIEYDKLYEYYFSDEEDLAFFICYIAIVKQTIDSYTKKASYLSDKSSILNSFYKTISKIGDCNEFLRSISRHYILTTKQAMHYGDISFKHKFFECFDDKCNIIEGKYTCLHYELEKLFDTYKDTSFYMQQISKEEFIQLLCDQQKFLNEQEVQRQKFYEEQAEKIQLKQIEKEKSKKEIKQVQMPVKKEKRQRTNLEKELTKYIDLTTGELRKSVIDRITIEELVPILKQISVITKSDINNYINIYNEYLFEKRIVKLKSMLSKQDYSLIISLKEMDDEFSISCNEEIKDFITSDEFMQYSSTDIKKYIESIIKKYKNHDLNDDVLANYLVFPNKEFLQNELSLINDGNSLESYDTTIKNIIHHLYKLEYHSVYDVMHNVNNAFHELKKDGKKFTINGVTGYRFGARKAKICLLRPNICRENQEMLSKYYNTEGVSHLILVFGVGSIVSEDEESFYDRAKKQGESMQKEITRICNLFTTPFTTETFMEVQSYIDNSTNEILTIKEELENKKIKKID